LFPQWSVVESKSWWKNSNLPQWENAIDIQKIKQQPWAKNLILGLAGEYNEREARANVVALGEKSAQIIQEQKDAPLKGYYFPVEADPTWLRVSTLGHVLEKLPHLSGLVFTVVKANLKTMICGLKVGCLNKRVSFFKTA